VSARGLARAAVWGGTALALGLTAHTAVNLRQLRIPAPNPPPAGERVSVLLPVRDEAHQVAGCLRAVLASTGVPDVEVLVLDDGSSDGTADVVRAVASDDPRVTLLTGTPPPPTWLGKPHACAQLADAATGSVLVFVDADVRLRPHALAATVALLRGAGLDLVCPYPRQRAVGLGERLVQPLLQWSWLTTLPLGLAERSARPSLSAANGQLLAVAAATYRRAGGHAAVRSAVLDDVALVRAVKAAGGVGGVADGTALADCRMYRSWAELADGYGKSLWAAFGSPVGAAGVTGLLAWAYVLPPLAALAGSPVGLLGYAAGVAGRVLAGRRTGARVVPDAAAHPLSVLAFGYLVGRSWHLRGRGILAWKGRALPR
jgi:hypothetical protein